MAAPQEVFLLADGAAPLRLLVPDKWRSKPARKLLMFSASWSGVRPAPPCAGGLAKFSLPDIVCRGASSSFGGASSAALRRRA